MDQQPQRIQHDLVQGSDEWHEFRLTHDGASEAAAMLGLQTKKTTRAELMFAKHTGIAKEFSQYVQEKILDGGHEAEALARPIIEEIIGESLYAVTYSYGRLSASCDGLTASDQIAMEHKRWNKELAASIAAGILPDEYMPQCQQVMYVTGAEKLLFVCSDGTRENMVWMWVYPDQVWVDRIIAGWNQFHEELKTYTPPEVIPAAVARPTLDLPVPLIEASGAIAIQSNLTEFGRMLNAFIENIPEEYLNERLGLFIFYHPSGEPVR
jgi:predicted phage-related endonuclease